MANAPNIRRQWWRQSWFKFVVLLLAPAVILLAAWLWVKVLNSGSHPPRLIRRQDSDVAWTGGRHAVHLVFSGVDSNRVVERKPIDVMVCLDRSTSMGDPHSSATPLSQALQSTIRLCNLLGDAGARVGLITFKEDAQVISTLTDNAASLADAVRKVEGGGNTDIGGAMLTALETLRNDPTTSGRRRLVVVLTDGQDDPDRGQKVVDQLNEEQPAVIAVGIAIGENSSYKYFSTVFDEPNIFLPAVHASDIDSAFSQMVRQAKILPEFASGFRLRERFDPRDFRLTDDPATIPFLRQSRPSQGELEFGLPLVFKSAHTFTYNLTPRTIGIQRIALDSAVARYSLSSGAQMSTVGDRAPRVLILSWWLILLLWLPALLYLLFMPRGSGGTVYRPKARRKVMPRYPSPGEAPRRKVPQPEPIPSLIIGIGGRGAEAIVQLKHVTSELFPTDAVVPFDYCVVDVDRRPDSLVRFCDQSIDPAERYVFPESNSIAADVSDLISRRDPILTRARWFRFDHYLNRPDALRIDAGTRGDRLVARLALIISEREPDGAIARLCEHAKSWMETYRQRGERAQILLVGSTYGGTSSGVVIDLAHRLRTTLEPVGVTMASGNGKDSLAASPVVPMYLFLTSCGRNLEQTENVAGLLYELERAQIGSPFPHALPTGWPHGEKETFAYRPLFDRVFMLGEETSIAQLSDIMFQFCEASQAAALTDGLNDATSRIQQLQSEDDRLRVADPLTRTIRFPRGRIAEMLAVRAARTLIETQFVGTRPVASAQGTHIVEAVLTTRGDRTYLDVPRELQEIGQSRDGGDISRNMPAFYQWLQSVAEGTRVDAALTRSLPGEDVIRMEFARDLQDWLRLDPQEKDPQVICQSRVGKLGDLERLMSALEDSIKALISGGTDAALALPAPGVLDVLSNLQLSVTAWKSVLAANSGAAVPDSDVSTGLTIYLHKRLQDLRTQNELLEKLDPSRTYLLGGTFCRPKYKMEALYQSYVHEPVLERATMARLLAWRVDPLMRLALDFGSPGQRAASFILTDVGEVPIVAQALWKELSNYLYQNPLSRLDDLTLADVLDEDSINLGAKLGAPINAGTYVTFSYPDVSEWKEFTRIERKVRTGIHAPFVYRKAVMHHPLMISVSYFAPDRLAYQHPDEQVPTPGNVQLGQRRDILRAPFNQMAESETAQLIVETQSEVDFVSRIPSSTVRAVSERTEGLDLVAALEAIGWFSIAKENLLEAWCLTLPGDGEENRRILLNEWGSKDKILAAQRLIIAQCDARGAVLPLDLMEERWKSVPTQTKVDSLRRYAQSLLPANSGPQQELDMLLRRAACRQLSRLNPAAQGAAR